MAKAPSQVEPGNAVGDGSYGNGNSGAAAGSDASSESGSISGEFAGSGSVPGSGAASGSGSVSPSGGSSATSAPVVNMVPLIPSFAVPGNALNTGSNGVSNSNQNASGGSNASTEAGGSNGASIDTGNNASSDAPRMAPWEERGRHRVTALPMLLMRIMPALLKTNRRATAIP